jgi:hypothetical protein
MTLFMARSFAEISNFGRDYTTACLPLLASQNLEDELAVLASTLSTGRMKRAFRSDG